VVGNILVPRPENDVQVGALQVIFKTNKFDLSPDIQETPNDFFSMGWNTKADLLNDTIPALSHAAYDLIAAISSEYALNKLRSSLTHQSFRQVTLA